MQLRFLQVTGPNAAPAVLEFGPGLNVIYGGSNTGKSHVLRLIDFALGAKDSPQPIVEQAGYDLVHLGLLLDDGSERTLVRALQGGGIRLLEGFTRERPGKANGIALSAQHSAKTSLSKYLLEQLGADGARIRTDASGKTRELSFRDLVHHSLIEEAKIQSPVSPILTGQIFSKTAETSIFKYLLLGVDDAALDVAKPDPNQPVRQEAQLELLDKQIRDLDRQITESDHDFEELARLELALDEELNKSFQIQETTEATYQKLTASRRELRRSYDEAQDRVAEIETLQARFALLAKHYESDQRRLTAIIEAGGLFELEDGAVCPICGAEPGNHRPEFACDGDVSEIIAAAMTEIADLTGRAHELVVTTQGLEQERDALQERIKSLLSQIGLLQENISTEVPSVQIVRAATNQVVQRKLTVQRSLDLVRRRDALLTERNELGVAPGYDSSTIVAQQHLDGAVLDELCQVVEKELSSWQFPDSKRVFFEVPKMDISVGGKPRAANGKGVRALLHGAFSVGLLRFCRERSRAHPGFLMLDSLFITYKDPSDAVDQQIASTPLKDRAFEALARLPKTVQLIVLENVDVPQWLSTEAQCVHFTGQPGVGRPGLFPVAP